MDLRLEESEKLEFNQTRCPSFTKKRVVFSLHLHQLTCLNHIKDVFNIERIDPILRQKIKMTAVSKIIEM